jgi:hypothetical protein
LQHPAVDVASSASIRRCGVERDRLLAAAVTRVAEPHSSGEVDEDGRPPSRSILPSGEDMGVGAG